MNQVRILHTNPQTNRFGFTFFHHELEQWAIVVSSVSRKCIRPNVNSILIISRMSTEAYRNSFHTGRTRAKPWKNPNHDFEFGRYDLHLILRFDVLPRLTSFGIFCCCPKANIKSSADGQFRLFSRKKCSVRAVITRGHRPKYLRNNRSFCIYTVVFRAERSCFFFRNTIL